MKDEAQVFNVSQLFFEQAKKRSEQAAIIEYKSSISYGALARKVKTYAAYLKKKGLSKGDRVLVFMPISIDLYTVVLGIMQVGAVAVFLDPWSDLKRLQASVKSADCRAIVAERKLRWLSRLLPVFRNTLKLKPGISDENRREEVEPTKPQDTALITYTTGSSGVPKGANRTHAFLKHQLIALRKEVEPLSQDVCLTNLPVFTLSHLADGITSVIPDYNPRKPSQMSADRIITQLRQHQVRTLVASPDFLMRLTNTSSSFIPDSLQRIFTGGAPVFPDQAKQIAKSFPAAQATVAYGSTEAEPISSIEVPELLADQELWQGGLPVGNRHPDCKVKIIAWQDEVLQKDEVEWIDRESEIGEIVISGPHVLKEYYRNPSAQRRYKFTAGGTLWHRTGDSGFLQQNQLYLTGPCKQLITNGSELLSPFLIEYQLRRLPSIAEGTLIIKNGKKRLCVVKEIKASKKQVMADLTRADLPFDEVHYFKSLPKDPRHNSKIDYSGLS